MGTHLIERFTPRLIVDGGYSLASGNSFVNFGFVTDSASMLQALRDLATAKKESLLSDESTRSSMPRCLLVSSAGDPRRPLNVLLVSKAS